MYDIEREKKILEILEQRGSISVNRLATLIFCSGSTVRRDLTKMEKKGLVKRSFGFVSLAKDIMTEETSFSAREAVNISLKKRMAKQAASLLKNGQVVFIDSSTTLFYIVPYLNDLKNLLIITNGLKIAADITSRTPHKVIIIGGEVQPHTNSSLGSSAINQVAFFHADVALFSCTGVSLEYGFSEASYDSAEFKQRMIYNSDCKIFVFDSSKFGQNKAFKTCDISNVNAVIIPNDLNENIKEEIKKKGVDVIECADSII